MFNRTALDFLRKSTIYEVNLRQYTSEGTIEAFMKHLPRIKDMGVDVIWLMPIHPIGKTNRKGSLGSYYSISDYKQINPEYGDLNDFSMLVEQVHQFGMKIIIDWVANHASWDNIWTTDHPEYFCRDSNGQFQSPYDWSDVIQLDHSNPDAHQALTDAMCYWVENYDIDGFRADLAHLTPLSYWVNARKQTEKIKPGLIWLAETEDASYYEAFDVNYAWKWMHATEGFVKQKHDLSVLLDALKMQNETYPSHLFQLYFTSNHDENSWNGTEFEKYGIYADAFAVFSFFFATSVPLIYSGQEIPLTKRIEFFDKDAMDWSKMEKQDFYSRLAHCRKKVCTSDVFSFLESKHKMLCMKRGDDENHVFIFMNLGEDMEDFHFQFEVGVGYRNVMVDDADPIFSEVHVKLNPGDYILLERI